MVTGRAKIGNLDDVDLSVVDDVTSELDRQLGYWGRQDHGSSTWLSLLGE